MVTLFFKHVSFSWTREGILSNGLSLNSEAIELHVVKYEQVINARYVI